MKQRNPFRRTLLACYCGYGVQAVINNLAPLLFVVFQDRFAVSLEEIGRLILINFGTQLFVDWLAIRFVDRIGYRKALVIAHLFSAAGLLCLGLLPMALPSPYIGLVIAVMLYAVGGGLIEVLISPIVDSLPGDAKASAMSLLHSFYCWGQVAVILLTTLGLHFAGNGLWWLFPLLWAILPLFNLTQVLRMPLMPPLPEEEKTPLRKLFSSRVFLVAMLLMLCAGAAELSMSQWSSLFAEKGLQVPKMVGDLLGPCLFAVLMGAGRTLYGFFGQRLKLKPTLMASATLCVACYALTVLAENPFLSLLGCALCGLSVSLMWPGTLSLASERYPGGGTAMFGMMALTGDLGASIGPWLSGLVSDAAQKAGAVVRWASESGLSLEQCGLKVGLAVAALFPAVMLIGLLFLRQKQPIQKKEEGRE